MAPKRKVKAKKSSGWPILQGLHLFYDEEAQKWFNQQIASKFMGTWPVDHYDFDPVPLFYLFKYQNLLEFISLKYPLFYKEPICEFYANLHPNKDKEGVFEYISMVHRIEFEFNDYSIANFLGWTDYEVREDEL